MVFRLNLQKKKKGGGKPHKQQNTKEEKNQRTCLWNNASQQTVEKF